MLKYDFKKSFYILFIIRVLLEYDFEFFIGGECLGYNFCFYFILIDMQFLKNFILKEIDLLENWEKLFLYVFILVFVLGNNEKEGGGQNK